MKKIISLFCLLLISGFAFSQWTWQNPLPQGNKLLSVYFTDASTGYIAGDVGTILKTPMEVPHGQFYQVEQRLG